MLPVVGGMMGWKIYRRNRPEATESAAAASSVAGVAIALLPTAILFFFLSCFPAPGEGLLADRGRTNAQSVLLALEQYHTQHGLYPDSLQALVPTLLTDSARYGPDLRGRGRPLSYVRTGGSFTLSFEYGGPGLNTCKTNGLGKPWQCSGLF
ncbi:MAG: hypothetical protein ABJC26_05230 [Gemmatimonadaceae bacterium]